MSNINFEAALKYIDLGSYDKAVEKLKLAIDEESSKDNDTRATEYHCVLGELYAQLGKEDEAREEFTQVIQFYPCFCCVLFQLVQPPTVIIQPVFMLGQNMLF